MKEKQNTTISIKNIARAAAVLIGGLVGFFIDNCNGFSIALLIVSITDFIASVLCIALSNESSSGLYIDVSFGKLYILLFVGFGYLFDYVIIRSYSIVQTAIVFFCLAGESFNLFENIICLYVPFSKKIKDLFGELSGAEENENNDIGRDTYSKDDVSEDDSAEIGTLTDEDGEVLDDEPTKESVPEETPSKEDDESTKIYEQEEIVIKEVEDLDEHTPDEIIEQKEPDVEKDVETDDQWVTLALTDTDGELNTQLINDALKLHNVKLLAGTYPFAPGVVVNGRILDLCGSHLISTKRFYSGTYIVLCGVSPCIRNGILSGLYVAAPGEEGYRQFEGECAIGLPVGGYTNAIIEDITLDHWCGAGVGSSGSNLLDEAASVRHTTPYTAPDDGWFRFDLTDGFRYITARHAIGYNYFISESNVIYHFVNRFGDVICEASGIPGEPIERPTDAVAVIAKTDLPTYVRYGLFEYLYDNTVSIMRCKFICNQRLGIANLAGDSLVKDCISRSNGFPREDHTGISHWDSSTSGFIDIEDIQTPRLTIDNCSSENENLNIASRAYYLTVINSPKLTATAYDGWHVKARNSGKIKMLFSAIKHATLDTDGEVDDTVQLVNSKQVKHDFGTYPVLPSEGGGFYNCTFVIDRTAHLQYGKVANGTFSNCDITLNTDWILSHGTDPTLTFINCRIKTNGHYIIKQNVAKKGSLKFSGCVFDTTDTIACGPFIPTITISPEYPEL